VSNNHLRSEVGDIMERHNDILERQIIDGISEKRIGVKRAKKESEWVGDIMERRNDIMERHNDILERQIIDGISEEE